MSKFLYQREDDDICYDLDYWREFKISNNIKELELLEMKECRDCSERWCNLFGDFIDDGDCGKAECKEYVPQNGKRGKCVYKGYVYTETGKRINL